MNITPQRRLLLTAISVVVTAVVLSSVFFGGNNAEDAPRDVSLDELETLVAEDRLLSADIRVDADVVVGTLSPEAGGEPVPFETPLSRRVRG